jgi:axial budding pattern protein 2
MIVVLLYFLALLVTAVIPVTSSVVVVQPLNNQLPLIARVNQLFSWSFSPLTFSSSDGILAYTTSSLPAWLSFDASTQTFHGTPSSNDEGNPEITVTAHASGSSTSSKFTLCVTHYPPPTLNISLSDQFNDHNPSISSVYLLRPNSAIITTNPTLRVPHKWSFSIGFEGNTFVSQNNLFYELRLANGSDAPDYMNFNSKTITLDGVVPSGDKMTPPLTLPFLLYASDQEGYSASTLPFTIVVADHELAQENTTLPEINITTSNQFSVSLLSFADFTGVIVDGDPIQPSNISTLDIDVSGHDWLKYDAPSRTLSGNPGVNTTGSHPSLPVTLTTIFGQSIKTSVTLALVESYFVLPELPSWHVSKGDAIQFNLGQWFSNSTGDQRREDASITVAFSQNQVANWLRFDPSSTELTGTVPLDYDSDEDHVTITFTAYSQVTHSTSHTSFDLYVADTGLHKSLAPDEPNGLSKAAHKRLVLVLVITFGLVGGLCLICGFFAIVRRWARVEDTAALGEEGRHAWSEKDRRWYGVTLSPRGTRIIEKTGRSLNPSPNQLSPSALPQGRLPNYGHPGLGLSRVSEHSQSIGDDQSTGIMSKREFMSRIKETVRQVSDKYSKKQRRLSYDRPVIGKPILIPALRPNQTEPAIYVSPSNPFDDIHSLPGSTFMTGSPSTSTAEHSIPRRRADFAPPRNLAQVHFEDSRIVRQLSTASLG